MYRFNAVLQRNGKDSQKWELRSDENALGIMVCSFGMFFFKSISRKYVDFMCNVGSKCEKDHLPPFPAIKNSSHQKVFFSYFYQVSE